MRVALRGFRKSPAFALTAVMTIALGIGASAAIFSVVSAVLLRPLPYPGADRLTLVFWENPSIRSKIFLYSNGDFFDLRSGSTGIFEDMAGIAAFRAFVPERDGSAEQIRKALVTTNFFRMMGAKIALGRDFNDDDAAPRRGQPLIPIGSAAILSYEYFERRYGGSADVLGQTIADGPRIVGVLAPGFRLFFPPGARIDATPDFYVANDAGYDTEHRNLLLAGAIGKLKRGMTLANAQSLLDTLRPEIRKNSLDHDAALRLEPMARYLVDEVRPAILALMGAVIFLLLIACANVANLMLVRASARERELAVRAALGGSWRRLAGQMLAEAGVVASAGTAIGMGLAWAGTRALMAVVPAEVPRLESASVDWRVVAFAAVAGLLALLIAGFAPVFRATRPDLIGALQGTGAAAAEREWFRGAIVIAETALSFVLLIGAGLMARSFLELRRVDPGYDPRGVLTFFLTRDWPLTRQEGRIALLNEIQARLRALPGVEDATAALMLPLDAGIRPESFRTPLQRPDGTWEGIDFQEVMPDYFETLRTPVLAGRTFTAPDNLAGRNLAVVDEIFARRAFPNESAVGKSVQLPGPGNPSAEIIGVVANQRLFSLAEPSHGTLYLADGAGNWGVGVSRYWMVRTDDDPARLAPMIRVAIRGLDRQLVISKIQTMETLVQRDQAGTRFELFLIGVFAAIAVFLASVGLYGVLATIVRRRTAEIGLRMALGAAPPDIFRLVVGRGLRLSVIGVAIGWIGAIGATRIMSAMLVKIAPADPATFAAMTVLFLSVAATACWIPAARAARVDPMTALRRE